MSIKDSIISELEHEAQNTKKMIDRLPDEKANWQPHQKSMSLKALATHIGNLQTWFNNALKDNQYDFKDATSKINYTNFKLLGKEIEDKVARNIEFVKTTDDAFWQEEFTFKIGGHIVMKAPKIVAYRMMLTNHLIHHRGQLSNYVRMLDIPVPGMYGPSADEK